MWQNSDSGNQNSDVSARREFESTDSPSMRKTDRSQTESTSVTPGPAAAAAAAGAASLDQEKVALALSQLQSSSEQEQQTHIKSEEMSDSARTEDRQKTLSTDRGPIHRSASPLPSLPPKQNKSRPGDKRNEESESKPQLSFSIRFDTLNPHTDAEPIVHELQTSLALTRHLGHESRLHLAQTLEREGLTALLEESLLSTSLQPLMIACASGHTVYRSTLNLRVARANQKPGPDNSVPKPLHATTHLTAQTSIQDPGPIRTPEVGLPSASSLIGPEPQVLQLPCIIRIDYASRIGQPHLVTVQAS